MATLPRAKWRVSCQRTKPLPPTHGHARRLADERLAVRRRPQRALVPDNLEALPSDELVQLVKDLAAERDGLERDAKRQATAATPRTASTASTATPASAGSAAPNVKDVQVILGRLRAKAEKAIKKTKHSQSRKPYTEVTEGIGNKELALALMRGQSAYQKSDTARMTRWLFDEDAAISNWLGIERQIRMLPQQGSNPSQPTRDFPPRLTRAMPGRVAQIPSPSTARCSASPDRAPRSTPTQAWSRSRSSGRAPRIC